MTKNNVTEQLIAIIAKQLDKPIAEIDPSMSLKNDLSMDSIQMMSVITAVDNQIGMTIAYEKYEEIDTIQDVANSLVNTSEL